MNAVAASKDAEVHEAFRAKLSEIGGAEAEADMARLPEAVVAGGKRALAVDDSKSMLALYRSILTSGGYEPLWLKTVRMHTHTLNSVKSLM